MTIRPFEVEDVSWTAPLAEGLFSAHDHGYGDAIARWGTDPEVVGWVAEQGGRATGFVLLGRLGVVGAESPTLLEVLAIGVRPEVRRTGAGRSLLARVLQYAKTQSGVREIRLTVAEDNRAARGLFEQAGFRVDRADDGAFAGGQRALRMRWLNQRSLRVP